MSSPATYRTPILPAAILEIAEFGLPGFDPQSISSPRSYLFGGFAHIVSNHLTHAPTLGRSQYAQNW
jgi:hypothetical protein